MFDRRTIICFASNWAVDPTSKHQIMKRVSRENRVVWVNYHGSRKPKATSVADIRSAVCALKRVSQGTQWINEKMIQVTPFVLPGATHRASQNINRMMVTNQVKRALRQIQGDDPWPVQVWTFAPDVWQLAGRFDEELFLYYCVDQYREFDNFDSKAVESAEKKLIDRSDIVITTSSALYADKKKIHPNTHLVRHGVDVKHFRQALNPELNVPEEIVDLPRPIIGFFGLIHHWIDCDLIAEVARLRPDYSFVCIGDDHICHPGLRSLENVHMLGRRPYVELPAFCKGFDAAILPFTRGRMTQFVNPIKLREYLAAGLPIVSTGIPEAIRYTPEVIVADGPIAFANACDQAIKLNTPQYRRQVSQCVRNETWEAVIERLSTIVTATVDTAPEVNNQLVSAG